MASLSVYDRFLRWRRRQRQLWPGLFHPSLPNMDKNEDMEIDTDIKLFLNRDTTAYILINNVPIIICDACGAILTLPNATSCCMQPSSASTQSPQKKSTPPSIQNIPLDITCHHCSFSTPLSTLRRVLYLHSEQNSNGLLPSCGPNFSQPVAFALLIEAVGAPKIIQKHSLFLLNQNQRNDNSNGHNVEHSYHPWFHDIHCRMQGLQALFSTLGLNDHQQLTPTTRKNNHNKHLNKAQIGNTNNTADKSLRKTVSKNRKHVQNPNSPSCPLSIPWVRFHAEETEQFFKSNHRFIKHKDSLSIPFSVQQLFSGDQLNNNASSSSPFNSSVVEDEIAMASAKLLEDARQILEKYDFEAHEYNHDFNEHQMRSEQGGDVELAASLTSSNIYSQIMKLSSEFVKLCARARYFNHNLRSF